jgi:hypothetical protein
MARTPKELRVWIKEEKRIVRLLYSRGLLVDWKIKDLYWASYTWLNRKCYHTKDKKYRFPRYMPEIHFGTSDYWGECDEHSIVRAVNESQYWLNVDTINWDGDGFPISKFPKMSRKQYIKYLSKMPVVVPDKKINKILKRINDE